MDQCQCRHHRGFGNGDDIIIYSFHTSPDCAQTNRFMEISLFLSELKIMENGGQCINPLCIAHFGRRKSEKLHPILHILERRVTYMKYCTPRVQI